MHSSTEDGRHASVDEQRRNRDAAARRLADNQRGVALGVRRYGPAFLRAYNRHCGHGSPHVALNAALAECGRQPHEVERRARNSERYARANGLHEAERYVRAHGLYVELGYAAAPLRPAPRRVNWPAGRPRASATRSSSASDSGPGDSDPPPPSGRVAWAWFQTLGTEERSS
jgi:hypothetical protein